MENKPIKDIAREAKNQYHREWYAKNKDKVKMAHARYWAKKAAALAASVQSGENNDDRKD